MPVERNDLLLWYGKDKRYQEHETYASVLSLLFSTHTVDCFDGSSSYKKNILFMLKKS